jgi:uncharacterized membrane protein
VSCGALLASREEDSRWVSQRYPGARIRGVFTFLRDLARQVQIIDAYGRLRTFLGRSLLLGLEFLVAGDVIKTVAIEPTRESVIVLAVIVLVRTVLSLSIDVEVDGRWPWQAAQQEAATGPVREA